MSEQKEHNPEKHNQHAAQDATHSATHSATQSATHSATHSATQSATQSTTHSATQSAPKDTTEGGRNEAGGAQGKPDGKLKKGVLGKAFIGIAGLIGAGKTTLATSLAEHLGLDVHYEPVADNEYLDDFYRDTARYSFAMQVYLLNRRFKQHQEIIWRGSGGVQDRTIYEDAIFAKTLRDSGLMDPRDYQTYVDLFGNLSNFMCRPNMIIYLDVKPETSLERIKERQRSCEAGVSLEYLERLYDNYEEFLAEISKLIPVLRVKWERFIRVDELADAITKEYRKGNFLREVTTLV